MLWKCVEFHTSIISSCSWYPVAKKLGELRCVIRSLVRNLVLCVPKSATPALFRKISTGSNFNTSAFSEESCFSLYKIFHPWIIFCALRGIFLFPRIGKKVDPQYEKINRMKESIEAQHLPRIVPLHWTTQHSCIQFVDFFTCKGVVKKKELYWSNLCRIKSIAIF